MCVYIYIYIYISLSLYIYIYIYYTYISVVIYIYTHIHISLYIYIYSLHVCTSLSLSLYIYIYIFIHRPARVHARPQGQAREVGGAERETIRPVSITRFPLSRFSPGAGLLRNPFFTLSTLRLSRGWVRKDGNLVMETRCTPNLRTKIVISLCYMILCYVTLYHVMLDALYEVCYTVNLRTNIVGFRGFDSSIILILRGGIPRPMGSFPESLGQATFAGRLEDISKTQTFRWPYSAPRNTV